MTQEILKINKESISKKIEIAAAIKIQSFFRGTQTRKKFGIQHLQANEQKYYPAFVVGNDPLMPAKLDSYKQPKDKIALIGTSGLRSVLLACKLGNEKNIPKIIIIDNSREVYKFWFAMREFMSDDSKSANQELFFTNLPNFLTINKNLYRDLRSEAFLDNKAKYPNQDIETFLKNIINIYGYEYIRSVISHVSLIQQSWGNSQIFIKIKNILNYLKIEKIYIYPSNIISLIKEASIQEKILQNIESMNPSLSIHTNYCQVHLLPEKVYLFDSSKANYNQTLFAPSNCKFPNDHLTLKGILLRIFDVGNTDHEEFYNRSFSSNFSLW